MTSGELNIRGAREHNLRDVSVDLPQNELICFTGVSGSGKSSLAFDTLYAEGQRRYIESLSAYARQFLGTLAKPDVDQISGLSPAIAIQQKSTGWNPRSTVGTVTGIYDFLRVLFARVSRQHCPSCGREISAQTSESIVMRILQVPEGTRVMILAPVVRGQKGEHVDLLEDLQRRGFVRARIDGQIYHLDSPPSLGRHNRHDIEVVIDRLTVSPDVRTRLAEAVESALDVGEGTVIVSPAERDEKDGGKSRQRSKRSSGRRAAEGRALEGDLMLSSRYGCTKCGIGFDAPSPQLFSFNSPTGMCMTCDGMGETNDFDLDLLIPDPSKSLYSPCIVPMVKKPGRWRRHIYEGVAKHVGFDIRQPWQELPAKACQALLWGTGDEHITFQWRYRGGVWKHGGTFEGIIPEMKQKYRNAKSPIIKRHLEKFMRLKPCSECHGQRLNPQARAARIGGHSIAEICALPVKDALVFFETLELERTEQLIAEEVLKEVVGRLTFLANVGLDYMTLDRKAPTLSGGESQRIRLAGQIGCGLVGVLYVLDEPSIGLHPRDNRQLLASLKQLRDMGNTVIVVEHDEDTMRAADLIVDFGPGPGIKGGRVTAVGAEEDLMAAEDSVTGAYLAGRRRIEVPKERRAVDTSTMTSKAAGSKKKSPQRKKTAKTTRKRSTRKKKRSTGSSTSQRKTRKKTSKRKSSKKKRT